MLNLYNREEIANFGEKINDFPVISIYLDTSKTKPNAKRIAYGQLKDMFQEIKKLDEVKENKDLEKMVQDYEEETLEWLDASFSELKNGVVLFLAGDDNLWEVIELPRAIKNRFYFQNQAEVKPLLAYTDEYEKLLGVVLDKRQVQIYVEYMGDIKKIEEIVDAFWDLWEEKDRPGYFPRPTSGGGYVEKTGKQEGVLRRYINTVMENLEKLKEKIGFDRLVIFAPGKIKHIVEEDLSKEMKQVLAKVITGNFTKANKNTIRDLLLNVEKELEQEEEQKMINELYNNLGNSDYKKGVVGLKEVLKHLNQQAVWYLLIRENIEFSGFIGKESGFLYADKSDNELGEELIEVKDLTNDIIAKAIDQDARVNFIPEDRENIDKIQNIGAMVRFKL